MEINNVIKDLAVNAVESTKPVKVILGKVTSVTPIVVNIEQKLTLDKDFLLFLDTCKSRYLEVGDNLVLLRIQGGQQFVVLGKTEEAGT